MIHQTCHHPFYTARSKRIVRPDRTQPERGTSRGNLSLQAAPCPTHRQPVPHLTSLYHFNQNGDYGNEAILALQRQPDQGLAALFQAGRLVFDPCRLGHLPRRLPELASACLFLGHPPGLRRLRPRSFPPMRRFASSGRNPPYWRQKLYADDPRDLIACPTAGGVPARYGLFPSQLARALKRGGKLAVLMGDYPDRDAGFLPWSTTPTLAFAAGLRQHCTDIVRSCTRRQLPEGLSLFLIPTLHDVVSIFD